MEHGPSWEANSNSASQENHCIMRNPKVNYQFTNARQVPLPWVTSSFLFLEMGG